MPMDTPRLPAGVRDACFSFLPCCHHASDALAGAATAQGDLQSPPCPAAADGLVRLQVACGTAAQAGLQARLAEEQQARAALEAEAPNLRSQAQAAQQDRAELEQDLADLQKQARQVVLKPSPPCST